MDRPRSRLRQLEKPGPSKLAGFGTVEGERADRQAGLEFEQGKFRSFKRAQDLIAYLELPGAKAKVRTK